MSIITEIAYRTGLYLLIATGLPFYVLGMRQVVKFAKEQMNTRKGMFKAILIKPNRRIIETWAKPEEGGMAKVKGKSMVFHQGAEYIFFSGVWGNTPTVIYNEKTGEPVNLYNLQPGQIDSETLNRLMEIAETKGMQMRLKQLYYILIASVAGAALSLGTLALLMSSMAGT